MCCISHKGVCATFDNILLPTDNFFSINVLVLLISKFGGGLTIQGSIPLLAIKQQRYHSANSENNHVTSIVILHALNVYTG